MASWPQRGKDQSACTNIRDRGGDEPAVLTKEVRAAAAAGVSSLLAFRPRHDARGPRRGAGRRQQSISGQAQLSLWLVPARRRRRSWRKLSRGAAARAGGGGTD